MSSRALALIIVLGLNLAACSRAFQIFPAGTLQSGVYFEFGVLDGSRTKNRIVFFNVSAVSADLTRELIWQLEGRARVVKIRYGVPPEKLNEQSPAPPLQVMHVYEVLAQDEPRGPMSAPGGAYAVFYISENGVPIECPSVDRCVELVTGAT